MKKEKLDPLHGVNIIESCKLTHSQTMKEKIIDTLKKALGRLVNNENDFQLQPVPVRVNNRFGR